MIRMQISVDADTYNKAKQVACQRGISLAELCRRALEDTLVREPANKPWMEYAGRFEGTPDGSTTFDSVMHDREKVMTAPVILTPEPSSSS